MKEKVNVAELLKDCPKGMELDCTICSGVKFIELDRNPNFAIVVRANNGFEFALTKYGQVHNIDDSKCVIFPKGKTTWEGFVPPCKFKDGDVVFVLSHKGIRMIGIYKNQTDESVYSYAEFSLTSSYFYRDDCTLMAMKKEIKEIRLATEEEKQKLFQAIKANGYKWNAETKTLEKLIVPKFKVGNKVKFKNGDIGVISEITDHYYITTTGWKFDIKIQDEWELVPNKFNIATLKPFDKVLTRANNEDTWVCNLYSHKLSDYFVLLNAELSNQCIPYNDDTKHLLATTDDCDEYYKTW